jgi:hypothetical protein
MQELPLPFAAFIGIDWADKKHDICLVVAGSDARERSVIEHRPAAIRGWAESLRERFGSAPIAVCLELSQGPIVSALLEHDFFVLHGHAAPGRRKNRARAAALAQLELHELAQPRQA